MHEGGLCNHLLCHHLEPASGCSTLPLQLNASQSLHEALPGLMQSHFNFRNTKSGTMEDGGPFASKAAVKLTPEQRLLAIQASELQLVPLRVRLLTLASTATSRNKAPCRGPV